jgi:cell envelope opacity-associated protein A
MALPLAAVLLFASLQDAPATRKVDVEPDTGPRQTLKRLPLLLPGAESKTQSPDEADGAEHLPSPPLSADSTDSPAPATDHVESGSTPVTTGATAHDPARAEADGGEPAGETLEVKVNSGDSLDSLFRRNGLSVTDLANMLRIKEAKKALALIKPGDRIEFVRDGEDVISLSRQLSEDRTLRVVRADEGDGYEVEFLTNPVERRRAQAHGKIATSLFEAGADVGLSDTLIMNLAGIFAWDIDFALEIREGDTFSVVYEEIWQDERRLRDGEILAAEFVNQGRVFRALRFEDPEGRVDYYTASRCRLRCAQGNPDQGRRRRQDHLPGPERRVWKLRDHPARRQCHDALRSPVEVRQERAEGQAHQAGAGDRLRRFDRPRDSRAPSLRV